MTRAAARIPVILLLAATLSEPACHAAEALRLSLREAMDLAVHAAAQPRLQAAERARDLAAATAMQAAALQRTVVEAGATETVSRFDLRALGVDFPQLSPFVANISLPAVVGPFTLLDARFTARKPLFDRAGAGQAAVAAQRVRVAEAGQEGAAQQVAADAARAYLAALYAQSNVELAQRLLRDAAGSVRFENERKQQGLVSSAEVRRAEMGAAGAERQVGAARSGWVAALLELRAALGLALDQPVELSETLRLVAHAPTAEESLGLAAQARPELKGYADQSKSLELTERAIHAQRLPSLTAFGSVGAIATAPTPVRAEPASVSYTYTAGLALRIPLVDGGRRAGQLAEIGVRRRELEQGAQQRRREVELAVRLAVERLRAAAEQAAIAARQVQLAEADQAQAQALYRAGEASGVEWAAAQSRLADLQAQYLAALYEHNLARLAWGAATGTVLTGNW